MKLPKGGWNQLISERTRRLANNLWDRFHDSSQTVEYQRQKMGRDALDLDVRRKQSVSSYVGIAGLKKVNARNVGKTPISEAALFVNSSEYADSLARRRQKGGDELEGHSSSGT